VIVTSQRQSLPDDITNFTEGRPVNAEFFVSMANIPKPKTTDKLSVAILPFKIFGQAPGDTGDEFMGIGLTDALISRLSGVQRLVVRPTSSILPFVNAIRSTPGVDLGSTTFSTETSAWRGAGSGSRFSY
jgi:hypothetical protein